LKAKNDSIKYLKSYAYYTKLEGFLVIYLEVSSVKAKAWEADAQLISEPITTNRVCIVKLQFTAGELAQ